jgi:glycosyltransferase involved in cell wall biosynthesis
MTEPSRPPRVLHIEAGRHLYGGARQVLYLLEGLKRQGVGSLLVCPAGSAIAEAARGHCERVHAIPMGGDLDLGLVPRLRRLIRSEGPDLVHVHSRRGADLFGGVAARLAGVPAVLSRRVDNPESWLAMRLKYPLYAKVITISEGIRQVLLAAGLPPGKVVCVRSAVDGTAYQAGCDGGWFRREFGLPPNARTLAVVAQLIERKGHGYLLDALPDVIARHPEVRVLLFGQGPLEAELRDRIRRLGLGLADQVRLAGFRSDLERILPCLDLVVHPATLEGLGVSLLQAAAAGLPIVAARAGGIPEVVRDGENGLLVPPGDSRSLGEAVLWMLDHPDEARALGARGRALVEREFSVPAMVAGNLRVYRELLGLEAAREDA